MYHIVTHWVGGKGVVEVAGVLHQQLSVVGVLQLVLHSNLKRHSFVEADQHGARTETIRLHITASVFYI